MCVKHHAGGLSLQRVVFLDEEQLTSMGVQEHMAPPLIPPTHSASSFSSSFLMLFVLENSSSIFKTLPIAFWSC